MKDNTNETVPHAFNFQGLYRGDNVELCADCIQPASLHKFSPSTKLQDTNVQDVELRKNISETIGFRTPEYIESIGMIGLNLPADRFEEILDKVMNLIAADRSRAVEEAKAKQTRKIIRHETDVWGKDNHFVKALRQHWKSELKSGKDIE